MVGKILVEGDRAGAKADQYVKFFQEHWKPYFGCPELLRFDAEGTWKSRALDDCFSMQKVAMDPIPGTRTGICHHWKEA